MKKQFLYAAVLALGISSCQSPDPQMVLEVDMNTRGADVPASMYGIFLKRSTMPETVDSMAKC